MMNPWIVLPILIPLLTAVILLLLRQRLTLVRIVSLTGSGVALVVALWLLLRVADGEVLVTQLGNWPAPYGITFVVDPLSAIMLTLAALMGLIVQVYAVGSMDRGREEAGFYPLYQFLLMGVCGSFITGDLFNLYVFFEIMLISSFGLMTLGGTIGQLEGGLKYVVINMVSSTLFVSALGIVYGTTGTLNMADLSEKLSAAPPGLTVVLASLFVIAFGIKAGLVPFFFWLPASYHTPPVAISAIFAGLLTKVGVYALIRIFTLIFRQETAYTHTLILFLAGSTMLIGVFGAVAQNGIRRVLSFHIISQIGYMVMGLGIFTPLALTGAIFYIIHHIIVKTALFLVSGLVEQVGETADLKKLGGLFRSTPHLALLFLVPAFSLAGFPPLSGFFSKFVLVQAGLESEQYLMVGVSLFVSVLTLFSMMKIWNEAFWKPASVTNAAAAPLSLPYNLWLTQVPIAALALLSILIGLQAETIYGLAHAAATTILQPDIYITAVLGR